jgi:hypothetical protein
MTSITSKLAAAKAAPRRTLDVVVSLDKDLSEQRAALEAEMTAAKESNDDRLSAPTAAEGVQEKLDELYALEADALVTLRFTRLPGDEWTALTQLCPPNPESYVDRFYKFGLSAVCKLAAQYRDEAGRAYGHVVEGDELTELTVNPVTKEDPDPINEWEDIFSELSGPEFTSIVDAIYSLNVHGPTTRYNELVKISASLTA